MNKTFTYFAYGSNLLAQRIHINNPSAIRYGIGKLENHRLDFVTYSTRWKGASATIVPDKGQEVWGAIWKLDIRDMKHLDEQEGVHVNIYLPLTLDIKLPNGNFISCRTYMQTVTPPFFPMDEMPNDRRPSPIYLQTILKGARESELPEGYLTKLGLIQSNGYDGPTDINLDLDK